MSFHEEFKKLAQQYYTQQGQRPKSKSSGGNALLGLGAGTAGVSGAAQYAKTRERKDLAQYILNRRQAIRNNAAKNQITKGYKMFGSEAKFIKNRGKALKKILKGSKAGGFVGMGLVGAGLAAKFLSKD